MNKLEELKAAFEASTPGEWKPCRSHEEFNGTYFDIDPEDQSEFDARPFVSIEAASGLVAASHDLFEFKDADARSIALAHNLMPTLLEAATMVRQARNLIAEAVNLHIYDEDNGDKPEPDCPYMAFLKESKELLGRLK